MVKLMKMLPKNLLLPVVKDGRMVDGMAEKGIEKSAAESATFMALYIKVLWGEREESTNHAG